MNPSSMSWKPVVFLIVCSHESAVDDKFDESILQSLAAEGYCDLLGL